MGIYSIANRTSGVTSNTATKEIRTASTDRAKVMEIGATISAATASVFALGRPAAIGVTPTSPQTVLAEDSGDPAGTVTTALAWGTGPTTPSNFFRRMSLPATIGAGFIWTFPRGLTIAISSSVAIFNILTGSVADVWVVVEE